MLIIICILYVNIYIYFTYYNIHIYGMDDESYCNNISSIDNFYFVI